MINHSAKASESVVVCYATSRYIGRQIKLPRILGDSVEIIMTQTNTLVLTPNTIRYVPIKCPHAAVFTVTLRIVAPSITDRRIRKPVVHVQYLSDIPGSSEGNH